MELGKIIFNDSTKPHDVKIENYDIAELMETALTESTIIIHNEGDRKTERITYDTNIRKKYLRRSDDLEDSLRTIRAYNYYNPSTAIIIPLPREFTVDKKITDKIIQEMKQKGLVNSTIQSIKNNREDVIAHCEYLYQCQLQCLSEKEKTEEMLNFLKYNYLEFPLFPYVSLGTTPGSEVPLRVTKEKRSTYYALSTSIPQNISDDYSVKTYITGCIHYMIWKIQECTNKPTIDADTEIYYDFLVKENATVYFFLNLQVYKD